MSSIRDKNMGWRRKFLFLPVVDIQNTKNVAASDIFTPFDGGQAADVITEIVSTDLGALLFSAGGALDTGSAAMIGPKLVPPDLDITKSIGVGVVWTHDATAGATAITFVVTYNVANHGAGIAGQGLYASSGGSGATFAVAEPTTALDTVIVGQTTTTQGSFTVANAGEVVITPRGIIKANTLLNTAFLWSFRVRMSVFTGGSTKIFPLGLLLDYGVHKTYGPGKLVSDPIPLNYLDMGLQPLEVPSVTLP